MIFIFLEGTYECKIADIAISKLHIDGYWYGVMEIENNTHWT
ncbi:hypothetical protein BVRB_1g003890 [Beta vulgaris subsp. vulgaris]|nr:hypothetical protein BVRB_1g003890 [Beta vulgaris subsp. vulgaris]